VAKVHVYRTYRWVDKDPIIDAVRTVVNDEHLKNSAVHSISGVATATLDNWFGGVTKKPQNSTICAVTSALGYVRRDSLNKDGTVAVGFTKARSLDYRDEIEKQADWVLKHSAPKKKRAKKKKPANGHGK
jgi:hypothetical protein